MKHKGGLKEEGRSQSSTDVVISKQVASSGWKRYVDTKGSKKRPYWHNSETGETTWTDPITERLRNDSQYA